VLLVKEESGWRLIRPVEARADEATVEGLLSDLSFLRANGFVDDPPGPADTGLSSPAFEVVLTGSPPAEGADPVRVGFQLGSTVEDNVRLAKGSHEALYKVPEGRLSDFPRELVAYRFKELSNFVPADASRFVLSFESAAEGALDQAKSEVRGERGDGGWTTSPESMAPYKARELLSELANLKAVEIVAEEMTPEELADAGLAPPRVAIQVWGEGDEPLATVELGAIDPEAGIFARTPTSDTIYRISYDLAEHIPVSREAFLNRFVSVVQVDDLDDLSADFSEDLERVD
jgi:hypothetical protein